ncbi:MAG: type VI secretion system protein TssA [Gammaproteobacteria bacterium]|nr:type VI secretion system protein TssA [Gammaproteobacteria bacterium]
MLDVPSLLSALSPERPAGEDLEYDPEFLALERSAQAQPERQMGDVIVPAEDPDWREVRRQALALFERTRDLRVAMHLAHSLVAQEGFIGLEQALEIIYGLSHEFWDSAYPMLDPDDGNDPTVRINLLGALTATEPMQRLLRQSALVRSRGFGVINLRAALIAHGHMAGAGENLNREQVTAAFQDADEEHRESVRAALTNSQKLAADIERTVAEKVGLTEGVDLAPLRNLLRQAMQFLGEAPAEATDQDSLPAEGGQPGMASHSRAAPTRLSGEIASRDDVMQALEKIQRYYTDNEPSSPVPILLKRAQSLVNADFATIVRNLLSDGVNQLATIKGPDNDDN